ncbi:MAG: DegT/DnrJ/EryC1/StrS family aminotransferase [Candidatus Bathyarchaeota archaeon]|nr:MAG: DegT/DnrJ/EryC1/StrS family aminotransferase [Candidatus Bathyarchaeota archaeon]
MKIPLSKIFVDQTIRKAALEALDSGWYILGERVKEFEQEFADFCGVKHAICTSSGTSAIFLALIAAGIKPQDEVIVPSFSFMATASPILHVHAKPVFADISLRTYTLDPSEIRKKISKKTRAVMPVHLYGHPADMDPIMEMASQEDLFVIEDAAQAHGAEYKGAKVGGIGHMGCFSFYPSKNMTVCGDGGIVTTNDEEIAEKVRMLRDHGRREKYVHEISGYNLRFNEIQAAIGLKQLERLPVWNENRRRIAREYDKSLPSSVVSPIEETWGKHVYYMYVIRTLERGALQESLRKVGVSTGIHYPIPIHKQPALSDTISSRLKLENTEESAETVLSLPMYPQLSQHEIEYVSDKVRLFFER